MILKKKNPWFQPSWTNISAISFCSFILEQEKRLFSQYPCIAAFSRWCRRPLYPLVLLFRFAVDWSRTKRGLVCVDDSGDSTWQAKNRYSSLTTGHQRSAPLDVAGDLTLPQLTLILGLFHPWKLLKRLKQSDTVLSVFTLSILFLKFLNLIAHISSHQMALYATLQYLCYPLNYKNLICKTDTIHISIQTL